MATNLRQTAPQLSALEILPTRLEADQSRVVLRPFHLGWQAKSAPGERVTKLLENILSLDDYTVKREYASVLKDFGERHWQTENLFSARFEELAESLDLDTSEMSRERQLLIGAYFCHEYTYSAAALMNPSIVPHPDQTGMTGDAERFVLSMRAVGEGHISSIAFREGIVQPDGQFDLWPETSFATAIEEYECDVGPDCVGARRDADSTLSNTVIFPITEQQRNGLEDLRLVRFDHGDGDFEWIGTYTAYSGSSIRSELLRTRDFRSFTLGPVHGAAGRDKGMALFPEKVNGRYRMIGRQDGKNLYLLSSDSIDTWEGEGALLMEPAYPWEFIQIGNCGSPIKTDEGWLLLTHGVGPMRKYSLGCALLDLDDPSRVIARTPRPLLTAVDDDRHGYVPNVVYSCGFYLTNGGVLLVPYGISDSAIGFGRIELSALFDQLQRV